jgi:GNAT superfamily N-acetyltransferase
LIDPNVRRADPSDADVLAELETAARAALPATRGGARWLETHGPVFDRWKLAVEEGAVFVAEIDGVVVGYLAAGLVRDPGLVVRIEQVYVDPGARELGFGDQLVAEVTAWGRQAGAALIEGEALPGDRDIKNLFERAGITARLITVSKRL